MAPMQKTIAFSIVILAIFSAIGSSIYIAYHVFTQSGLKIIKYEHFLKRIILDDLYQDRQTYKGNAPVNILQKSITFARDSARGTHFLPTKFWGKFRQKHQF